MKAIVVGRERRVCRLGPGEVKRLPGEGVLIPASQSLCGKPAKRSTASAGGPPKKARRPDPAL